MAGPGEQDGLLNLSMEGLDTTEISGRHMDGMAVLGEAVTQAEFLTEQVILQDLAGSKTIRDIAEIQAQLRGIGELASLQTIQEEHAYPASGSPGSRGRTLLKDAEYFIRSTYPDVATILIEDYMDSSPLLIVSSKYPDSKLLIDQSSLRLNLAVGQDDRQLECRLLTWNREVVRQTMVQQAGLAREVGHLVEDMLGKRFTCCSGLTLASTALPDLRKADIPHILLEKYDGQLVYRARECSYIVDQETNGVGGGRERREHCPHCRLLSSSLAARAGSLLQEPAREERGERRKRGRPRGSSKRAIVEEEEEAGEELVMEELVAEVRLQEEAVIEERESAQLEETGQDAGVRVFDAGEDFIMEDDPGDVDFASPVIPKRGRRKKMISKKVLEMETSKLRPGRKPKVVLPVTCPEEGCRQLLETLEQFQQHQTTAHPGSLVCLEEGCLKRFTSAEELAAHSRRHRGEKPFSCQECKREYTTRQDLRLHYRTHTGEKPFVCNVCGKQFAFGQQLRVHKAVHTGERNFLCSDCGSSFGSQSTLIDHRKRKHLNHFPHKCSQCPKQFFTRQELDAHIRTHTGEKPYLCKACNKRFSRIHHLKRHTETVHAEKDLNRNAIDEEELEKMEKTETHIEVSEDGQIITSKEVAGIFGV